MEHYKHLFTGYLQNQLNGEELEQFTAWLKNPENFKLFETWMEENWNTFELPQSENSTVEANQTFIPEISSTPKGSNNLIKWSYRIAAGVVLPIALGLLTYYVMRSGEPIEKVVYNEINVPLGSKTKITLADGSSIWLNSGSKLRYPQVFDKKQREVELTGEAYFDITKNPKQPFIVKASDIKIKVLGTAFNVKSYPEERLIETTLIRGSISLSKVSEQNKDRDLILKPNQRATYVKNKGKLFLTESEEPKPGNSSILVNPEKETGKVFLTNISDSELYTAWKDEKLIFKNESFEGLCTKLERWFNVKINIQCESVKKYHYTGTIKNETINDVIDILHYTMSFQYEINHSVINIWTTNK